MDTTKPVRLEELELWKLRAYLSERQALMSEITIIKMKLENLEIELDGFHGGLLKKYECSEFDNKGNIIYSTKE